MDMHEWSLLILQEVRWAVFVLDVNGFLRSRAFLCCRIESCMIYESYQWFVIKLNACPCSSGQHRGVETAGRISVWDIHREKIWSYRRLAGAWHLRRILWLEGLPATYRYHAPEACHVHINNTLQDVVCFSVERPSWYELVLERSTNTFTGLDSAVSVCRHCFCVTVSVVVVCVYLVWLGLCGAYLTITSVNHLCIYKNTSCLLLHYK